MEDLDPNSALEMLWDDTPALTCKQVELLNNKRDRAMRIRLARRKTCEALEKYKRKGELADMADHLKDVLMKRLFEMLNKETNITLMNNKLLSAKASIKVMAASSSLDSMVSSGSMISRRMHISWSMNIVIQSVDDRRTSLLDMAREWLDDVVCRRVVMENERMPASMMEEVVEMLPSVQWQDQVEVGMRLLSLTTPGVCDGDQEMDDVPGIDITTPGTCGGDHEMTDVPDGADTTPGTGGGDQEMANVQNEADTMPDACMTRLDNVPAGVLEQYGSHKRKRRGCPGSGRRRIVNCSEGQYYTNKEYYPTWRSVFPNLNVQY